MRRRFDWDSDPVMTRRFQTSGILCLALAIVALVIARDSLRFSRAQELPTATPNINWVQVELGVNVRSGPGFQYGVIGSLPFGAWVQPLARNLAGDWILIAYINTQGWVQQDLIEWRLNVAALPVIEDERPTAIPRPREYYVTPIAATHTPNANWVRFGRDGVYVRSGPGMGYAPVGWLYTGDVVDAVGRDAPLDWVLVRHGDGYGWIRYDLVAWIEPIEDLPVLVAPNLTPSFTAVPIVPSATRTPAPTATRTPSETPPPSPTLTLTATVTPSDTPEPTLTRTPNPTATPAPSSTPQPAATDTATATWTPSATTTPSLTPTLTPTLTLTVTPTSSDTPEPTATPTLLPTATATATDTRTPKPTVTLTATASDTPEPTPSDTPLPTRTAQPSATRSVTPSVTPSVTATASPSRTPRPSATASATPTPTITVTTAPTITRTPRPAPSSTRMPTVTRTSSPESTVTPLAVAIASATREPTPTLNVTATTTLTGTPTAASPAPVSPTPTTTLSPTPTPAAVVAAPGSGSDGGQGAAVSPREGGSLNPGLWIGLGAAGLVLLYLGAFAVQSAAVDRYREGFPLTLCPVCQEGRLYLDERRDRVLGIPRIRRAVRCDNCRSVLRQVGPQRWRYAVDRAEHLAFYDRLNGRVLTEAQLYEISPEFAYSPPEYIPDDKPPE